MTSKPEFERVQSAAVDELGRIATIDEIVNEKWAALNRTDLATGALCVLALEGYAGVVALLARLAGDPEACALISSAIEGLTPHGARRAIARRIDGDAGELEA